MDVITFLENQQTTSGLSILLHGIISLPDVTSYDKYWCNKANDFMVMSHSIKMKEIDLYFLQKNYTTQIHVY